jgi:hypothetical protein
VAADIVSVDPELTEEVAGHMRWKPADWQSDNCPSC